MAKKILVADDEKTIRETLSEFFTDGGYEVITAEDGLRAVEELTNSDIDVAMVDIRMPGLDGLEVLAKAKKSPPIRRSSLSPPLARSKTLSKPSSSGPATTLPSPSFLTISSSKLNACWICVSWPMKTVSC